MRKPKPDRVARALLLAALLLTPLAVWAAEETPPKIVGIEVKGNQEISAETILAAVTSKTGEDYSQETADTDRDAIMELGWFSHVDYSTQPEEEGAKLIFEVVENPKLAEIAIKGNTVFSDEKIRKVMKTEPGQISNNRTLLEDVAAIQELYREAGYILARVIDLGVEMGNVLRITIAEGVIEDVKIKGNTKTKTRVIARELRTKPGEVFNNNKVRRDLERIMNLDFFQDVRGTPEAGTQPGRVILVIEIKEKKTGMAALGVGWSSVQKFVGFVDVSESNLKGTGQRVSVRAEFGGIRSWQLGYYNPWIAPNRTGLNVGVYDKLTLREAFAAAGNFLYYEKRQGGNITLSRPLNWDTTLYATLRSDDISVRQYESQVVPADVRLLSEGKIRSLSLMGVKDTRDIVTNPTRGSMISLSTEFAGIIGGGAHFQKYGGDLRWYFPVGGSEKRKRVVAVRILAGLATGDPPWLEQYLVGGGETLRGYEEDRFPGTRMLVTNAEFRIPIGKNMMAVVFTDVGDAWGGAFATAYGDLKMKLHFGYGAGIRVITPIGPLRLDYGIGEKGGQAHFSVGHVF